MVVDFSDENFKEKCKYNSTMKPGKLDLHLNKYISFFFVHQISLKAKKSWHMGAVGKNQVVLGWINRYQSDDGFRIETISNAVDKFFKDKLDCKMKKNRKVSAATHLHDSTFAWFDWGDFQNLPRLSELSVYRNKLKCDFESGLDSHSSRNTTAISMLFATKNKLSLSVIP